MTEGERGVELIIHPPDYGSTQDYASSAWKGDKMTEEEKWKIDFETYVMNIWMLFATGYYKFETAWPVVLMWAQQNGRDHVLARDALAVCEGWYLRGPGRRLFTKKPSADTSSEADPQ